MPAASDPIAARHELVEQLAEARSQTDDLFGLLRPDSFYERPIPERHRIIFYVGHVEAFDWNLLRERALEFKSFHPEFDRLFAFGIDPVGGGLPADQPSDWPEVAEVRQYVRQIRDALDQAIDEALSGVKTSREFPLDLLLNVAIEHRLMHAETLAYMFHQLPLEKKVRPSVKPVLSATAGARGTVEIPAGSATLGMERSGGKFGWDNEFQSTVREVAGFEVDRYKVTNGRYLEFMEAGGYENPALWNPADWQWRREHNITQPVFWRRDGGRWYYRAMLDEIRLPLEWPAYVSHAEASAYARWAGGDLPTEEQWHRAAYGAPDGVERPYPWGMEAPSKKRGNFNFERWDPTPVNEFPDGNSGFGVGDLLGNGWEWTSSLFAPLPGFNAFPFYPGYSADFFDGKHYVMKGGSARTAAGLLRRSFRNWFQPHYQYVYAGFRCVKNRAKS